LFKEQKMTAARRQQSAFWREWGDLISPFYVLHFFLKIANKHCLIWFGIFSHPG